MRVRAKKAVAGVLGAVVLGVGGAAAYVAVAVPQIDCLWADGELWAISYPSSPQAPPGDTVLAYVQAVVLRDRDGAAELTIPAFLEDQLGLGFDGPFCNWVDVSDPRMDEPLAERPESVPRDSGFTETAVVRARFLLRQHEEGRMRNGDTTLLYSLGRRSPNDHWIIYDVTDR